MKAINNALILALILCISMVISVDFIVNSKDNILLSFQPNQFQNISFFHNQNSRMLSKSICKDNCPLRERERCTLQLIRTFHAKKTAKISQLWSLWPSQEPKAMKSAQIYSLSLALEWILQSPQPRKIKQVCFFGGYFSPMLLYLFSLSFPYNIQLLFIFDRNDFNLSSGSRFHTFDDEIFNIIDSVKNISSIRESNSTVTDVQFTSVRDFLSLLTKQRISFSCDILYFRGMGSDLLRTLTTLIHFFRIVNSIGTHKVTGSDEFYLLKDNVIPLDPDLSKPRVRRQDCAAGRIMTFYEHSDTSEFLEDCFGPNHKFISSRHTSSGRQDNIFQVHSCDGLVYGCISNSWFAMNTIPELSHLTDWNDFQGFSSFQVLDDEWSNLLEILIGKSIFSERNNEVNMSPLLLDDLVMEILGGFCGSHFSENAVTINKLYSMLKPSRTHYMTHPVHDEIDVKYCTSNDPDFVYSAIENISTAVNFLVSYSSRIFQENAFQLCVKIRSLSTLIVDDFGREIMLSCEIVGHNPLMSYQSKVDSDIIQLQFHFGCHTPVLFLPHYLCYQTEQPFSWLFQNDTRSYHWAKRIMFNALGIAVMSGHHKLSMSAMGFDHIFVLPFYTLPFPIVSQFANNRLNSEKHNYSTSSIKRFLQSAKTSKLDVSHCSVINDSRSCMTGACMCEIFDLEPFTNISLMLEDETYSLPLDLSSLDVWLANGYYRAINLHAIDLPFDVLFYGACTSRRMEFLTSLQNQAFHSGIRTQQFCVDWRSALFDRELQKRLVGSKLVANIHSYNSSSLAIHRMMYLYAMGKCIVSEKSTIDSELDREVQFGTVFADDIDDLLNIVDVISHDREKQFICEKRSLSMALKLDQNVGQLAAMIKNSVTRIQKKILNQMKIL